MHNYSPPQSQYFVEPYFAAITAANLLGYVSISLVHLATGILSILQGKTAPAPSSWMGSAGVEQSLKSYHRFSIELRSGLQLGHSNTFPLKPLKCCFSSMLRVIVLLEGEPPFPVSNLWKTETGFPSRISLYLVPTIIPSILTSFPVPADEKHPHSMMMPPPCFPVGMLFSGR